MKNDFGIEIKLKAIFELLGTESTIDDVSKKYKILPETLEVWEKEFLSNAGFLFSENLEKTNYKNFTSLNEATSDTLIKLDKVKNSDNKFMGIDTGFKNINDRTSGFNKGDLIVIASRPSMGKSSLALNMVLKAIERDEAVVYFSFEMPSEQLMLRLLSIKTSIPLQALRTGDLRDEQWKQLEEVTSELKEKNLFIEDTGYGSIDYLRKVLRKLKFDNKNLNMIFVDYLQLMPAVKIRENRYEILAEITKGLKQLAMELEISIIALSQLNRSLEGRDNKRPILSDLRDSGTIEDDADLILFLYRDDVYREAQEKEREMKAKAEGKVYTSEFRKKSEEDAEIIIGKQRNGPTGTVELIFQKNFTRFVDKTHDIVFEVVYEENDININIDMPPI